MATNSIYNTPPPTYFIIAGEQSADSHGALLMKAMLAQNPEIEFKGIGGKKMTNAGLNSIEDIEKLAVMGFVEVIRHLGFFRKLTEEVLSEIEKEKPNQIILIDYPGFNLRLAKKIKNKFDIPITYYVSPQLWAWKEKRINIIKKHIDQMLVIFPFEEQWYKERGVKAVFVGHPIFDEWTPSTKEELCGLLNLNHEKQVLVLYPGSRLQEVKRHLPILLQATKKMKDEIPSLQVILGAASQIDWAQWDLPDWIQVESKYPQKALECGDLVFVASGTSTVEATVFGTPMIVTYKMATLSWWLSKILVNVPFAGMVNILAEEEIMPELLQENATVEKLSSTALSILNNSEILQKMKEDLNLIQNKLKGEGASKRAAIKILELVK
ncbi:MAG: lipid-A-disaccharide synthase [Candidatus Marinimicrobia bacterium]|nr:lipid-A-disaccharide synthase [Candidatus Neomarinimicrobiota bacterium]